MEQVKQIATAAASAAQANRDKVFDLRESNLDDFMRIYTAGEEASDYERAAWRRRIRVFFERLTPTRDNGEAVLSREQVERFLTTVHADDEHFPRSAIRRRVDALESALPHISCC